jgi:hypothetical protein
LGFDSPDSHGIPHLGSSYAVYPLVYSAGPDGRYEISRGLAPDGPDPGSFPDTRQYALHSTLGDLNPFWHDPLVDADADGNTRRYVGQPLDERGHFSRGEFIDGRANGSLDHYDNLHNHGVEAD